MLCYVYYYSFYNSEYCLFAVFYSVLLNENGLINLRLIFALSEADYNFSYLFFIHVFSIMFNL